tara:strand:- start:1112 stop:1993 length:882 start_codon:yes stop_codon:yes gene_type:complete
MGNEEEVIDVAEVVELVAGTNEALVIQDPVKLALVNDLTPIAENMVKYAAFAQQISVHDQASADAAMIMEKLIAADVKTVKQHDVLSGIIKGLHALHKRWKSVENTFVPDMDESRRAIRAARIEWEEAEAEQAAAEQRRLQAIADEKARKEREQQEKLERAQREKEAAARAEEERLRRVASETKDASERKKLEQQAERNRKIADAAALKADMRQENAEAVAAPVINVNASRAVGGSRLGWIATVVNAKQFFEALALNPQLAGYVEIKVKSLAAAKRSNPLTEIPGVTFEQKRS